MIVVEGRREAWECSWGNGSWVSSTSIHCVVGEVAVAQPTNEPAQPNLGRRTPEGPKKELHLDGLRR
jgi:hypothetical protein